jgi:hypothetical protein
LIENLLTRLYRYVNDLSHILCQNLFGKLRLIIRDAEENYIAGIVLNIVDIQYNNGYTKTWDGNNLVRKRVGR